MAEGKKSFTAYCDWGNVFDEMTNEEAGKLVKHLFDYVRDKNPVSEDRVVKLSFIQMKDTLKRDLQKWKEKQAINIANGKRGGRPKTQNNRTVNLKTERLKNNPEKGVTVTVSDTVTDKVIKIGEEEVKKNTFSDSIFDIDVLESEYISNERVIKAVLENPKNNFKDLEHLKSRLKEFKAFLVEQAETTKTMKDFASHFRNWHISYKPKNNNQFGYGQKIVGTKLKGIL